MNFARRSLTTDLERTQPMGGLAKRTGFRDGDEGDNAVKFQHRSAYPDFIFDIARLIRTNAEYYLCPANGAGSDGRRDRPPDGSDRQC